MSATFVVRQVGDVTVVDASGRITLGEGSSAFKAHIQTLVYGRPLKKWEENIPPSRKVNLVINLEGVTYIDSSGIGELLGAFAMVTNAGGKLKLLHVGKRVQDLLQKIKQHTSFETFEDETAAIRSFAP